MTKLSIFDSPFLLGFDHFERMLDELGATPDAGYPPYNIEQTGEDSFAITVAVAGFDRNDLDVTIERNRLVVRGKKQEGEKRFLHRGIATRRFALSFILAEGMEVKDASLVNGMLSVRLARPPLEDHSRKVEIVESKPATAKRLDTPASRAEAAA